MVQLGWAIPQYFTCSLISMPVGNEEVIDMRAFYERQRPVLFSAFAVTYAMSMVANFADEIISRVGSQAIGSALTCSFCRC